MSDIQPVSLHDAARERYLSYAMSVITARALPDVRDGLKPVQRRILYTMFHELRLHPGNRYRKSAAVVGEVMGKYHPHGDQSIYDAMVRMAQDFSLRNPLVDPQGNFGSLDGDPPAAMRYTECRLRDLAEELLQEIAKDTVDYRDTYDGQRQEPIVLPAQFPQLLINGVEGIAVGLSTRIPPHNLGEVIDACVALIDGDATDIPGLMRYIQGPDLPTGGRILNDRSELLDLYSTGSGSLRVRGTWTTEKDGRRTQVIITSVPYGQNKAKLVDRIGSHIGAKKLPLAIDIRDESTDEVRIVVDLKQGASPAAVMAYLYKHTPLESTWPVHMNALIPGDRPDVSVPEKLDLHAMLQHWLDFRYETVRRRFSYDLRKLEERIHILEGFAIVFADLDEVIRIIRASEGRKDAANKLIKRYDLSQLQVDAILDLRLYKLARLEIQLILDELEEKRAEAAEIRTILGSEQKLWMRVRSEMVELRKLYADDRRTLIGLDDDAPAVEYDESAYIVKEDAVVVVTRDGWVKRQASFTALDKIRIRDGDELGWVIRTDTGRNVTFFASDGSAYTMRVDDVPSTTGHGKPLVSFFALPDRTRVVGVVAHDPVCWRDLPGLPEDAEPEDPPAPHVVSVTKGGRVQRFALAAHADPSNKNGRTYAKLDAADEVLAAWVSLGGELAALASTGGNVLLFPVTEVSLLKAAGKGTTAIKLKDDDTVLAFELAVGTQQGPTVTTTNGRELVVNARKFDVGSRAARGRAVIRRGGLSDWVREPDVRQPPDDGSSS